MEDNFRNVLIILSAIVISAIFIHGLWIIRKQKKSCKLNLEDEAIAKHVVTTGVQLPDDLSKSQILIKNDVLDDGSGQSTGEQVKKIDNSSVQLLDSSIEDDWFKDDYQENTPKSFQEDNSTQFAKDELGDELTPFTGSSNKSRDKKSLEKKIHVHIEPLYEQPVTQAKPTLQPTNNAKKAPSKAVLKRDQIEIDFDNQKSIAATDVDKRKKLESQVIILSVVMPANQQMFGAALLPSLLTLGLKYGEMNIFHRHEDSAGNGKVTFSLANIMNPGSFDLDSMENFATRGVSLFMTLPNAGNSLAIFEQMLNAAKQLAQEFNAQVIDDKRNVMTKQTEQHYLGKIREFDRKSRIALME